MGGYLIYYLMGRISRCTTKIPRKLSFTSWVILWTTEVSDVVCVHKVISQGREGCLRGNLLNNSCLKSCLFLLT